MGHTWLLYRHQFVFPHLLGVGKTSESLTRKTCLLSSLEQQRITLIKKMHGLLSYILDLFLHLGHRDFPGNQYTLNYPLPTPRCLKLTQNSLTTHSKLTHSCCKVSCMSTARTKVKKHGQQRGVTNSEYRENEMWPSLPVLSPDTLD